MVVVHDWELLCGCSVQVKDNRGRELGQGVVVIKDYQGHSYTTAMIEMTSGGALKGYLTLDVRVKVKPPPQPSALDGRQ